MPITETKPVHDSVTSIMGRFLSATQAGYTSSMALRLYAATTSQGKLRDFRTAAEAHGLMIEPLPGLETIPAPEEDGLTFAANATLKAVYYSRFAPGAWVLADDSDRKSTRLNSSHLG